MLPVTRDAMEVERKRREFEICAAVRELYNDSKRESETVRNDWTEFHKFYHGDQLRTDADTDDTGWHVYNLIGPAVNSSVSLITSNQPSMIFEPVQTPAPEDAEAQAHWLNTVHPQVWKRIHGQRVIADCAMNAAIYGVGFISCEWDPWLGAIDPYTGLPQGDIGLKSWHPKHVFWDPAATCIEDATYIIFVERLPRKRVEAMYGVEIEADERFATLADRHREGKGANKGVDVMRCWLRQGAATQGGGAGLRVPPQGRYLVICGNKVLVDLPNRNAPYPYKDGQIPVVMFKWTPKPNEFLGVGMVEWMKPAQIAINDLIHCCYYNLRMTGSNIITYRDGAIPPEYLDNAIGRVFPVQGDHDVMKVHRGIGFPTETLALLREVRMMLDDIGGRVEIPLAAIERSHAPSGRALLGHAELRRSRLGLTGQAYQAMLERLGLLMLSRYQQFYIQPRQFRYRDRDGNIAFGEFSGRQIPGRWEVTVDIDSTVPLSKAERFEKAMTLLQTGVYSIREFLDATDDPYKAQILRRMAQQEAAQTEQQEVQARELLEQAEEVKREEVANKLLDHELEMEKLAVQKQGAG